MTEHLGHEKHQAEPGRESTNVRNGTRPKTVISDAAGEAVLSLYAKGMTTGDISAHFAEICGSSVSKETISRITDEVVAEMQDWAGRPLGPAWLPVIVAIHVKVRDGQVANRPVYAAIGVTIDGCKDVLGLWMGTGGADASHDVFFSWKCWK